MQQRIRIEHSKEKNETGEKEFLENENIGFSFNVV